MKITPAQNYANEVPFGEGKYEIHGNKKTVMVNAPSTKNLSTKKSLEKSARGSQWDCNIVLKADRIRSSINTRLREWRHEYAPPRKSNYQCNGTVKLVLFETRRLRRKRT